MEAKGMTIVVPELTSGDDLPQEPLLSIDTVSL